MLKNDKGVVRTLIFAGAEGLFRSEVKKGRVEDPDIRHGLLGLSGGRARTYVRSKFAMYTPRVDPTFVRLTGGNSSLELRFRQVPPRSLLLDMRDVFCRHAEPGVTRARLSKLARDNNIANNLAAKERKRIRLEEFKKMARARYEARKSPQNELRRRLQEIAAKRRQQQQGETQP